MISEPFAQRRSHKLNCPLLSCDPLYIANHTNNKFLFKKYSLFLRVIQITNSKLNWINNIFGCSR
jgi:hypothetical protein